MVPGRSRTCWGGAVGAAHPKGEHVLLWFRVGHRVLLMPLLQHHAGPCGLGRCGHPAAPTCVVFLLTVATPLGLGPSSMTDDEQGWHPIRY